MNTRFRMAALAGASLMAMLPACGDGSAARVPPGPPLFTEVTELAGLGHSHQRPRLDEALLNIMPWLTSVGAAAAAGDYDGDGLIDLYTTNSAKGSANHLYHNGGDGRFEDRGQTAGLALLNGEHGVSTDCLWADYDNDGALDLYLVRWGRDALYRNQGDGTFVDVTAASFRRRDGSPGIDWANGCAAIAFDHDLDGLLDIYVGNFFDDVDLWNVPHTRIMHEDFEAARNGGRNSFYAQVAPGRFSDVAPELGVDDVGWTLAAGAADLNNDGIPDLYLADDFGQDQLFLGTAEGRFVDVTQATVGVDTKKGMNVDFGDFDNDGWLDIYVTNITTAEYLKEGNMLWHNEGPGAEGGLAMTDVALEAGAFDGGWGWGGKFADFDRDGDLDLLTVNGFISAGSGNYWYDLASWTVQDVDTSDAGAWPDIGERSFSGHERTRYFENDGIGSFVERAGELGIDSDRDGRGIVCFDYDDDGDIDVFLANQGAPPQLYRNDSPAGAHWLGVTLIADPSSGVTADAIGARVTLVTARGRQLRERDGGNSYCGQSDPRLLFGLGAASVVELLEVRWPDGGLTYLEEPTIDRYHTIRQVPEDYANQALIVVQAPAARAVVERPGVPPAPSIDPAELERLLASMETELAAGSPGHTLPSAYRRTCAAYDQHDRALGFLGGLVAGRPDDGLLQLEYACAYVDKIPTCGGLAAVVCKGTQARRSLDQLDQLIDREPDNWAALYSRGMNHLHWPRALLHSDDAVADFEACLEQQRRGADAANAPRYLRVHLGLGDAYTKDGEAALARQAWSRGLEVFPETQDLLARLAIADDDELLDYVQDQRNLERAIDTDLSFLDGID